MAEFRTKVPIDAEAIPSPQFMNMARDKKFMSHKKTVVIALGGNALLRAGESLSQANQAKNVKMAVSSIAEVARENKWNIILTHGNGPQVGFLALQQEAFGLDVLTAETQGMIGCQLDEGLSNELPDKSISVILTQVEVDAADPAFQKPTKPVGPFYAKYDEALAPMVKVGEQYRKVVASPLPKRIVELSTIEALVELGNVVICCGGGGVPVTLRDGELHGVPAVIDKDRTSALLARSLKVDALVMLTDVDGLYKNFGKPDQNLVSLLETSNLDNEWLGTLPPGSIGPKVASGIEFANATGGWAAIGSLNQLKNILEGTSGTRITNGNSNEAVSANFQEWNSATVQDWLRHDARLPEEHVEKLIATGNDSGASLASLDSEGLEKLGFPSRLSSFLLAEIKSAQEGSACPRVAASPYSWPHNRNISASNTAVVLVDFQESVFGGASSIVARAKEVVEAVRALKLPVIFTRGGYQPDLTECSNFQLWSNGGSVTVSGDALWNIIGDLSPDEGDKVLDHRPNSFHGELGTLLKSLGIQNAIIFGRTELCLRAQQEAQDSDIDALFVEDVSATTSVNLHRNSAKLASVYGAVTSVDFVLTGLASLK